MAYIIIITNVEHITLTGICDIVSEKGSQKAPANRLPVQQVTLTFD
jgi:hypothetical protein